MGSAAVRHNLFQAASCCLRINAKGSLKVDFFGRNNRISGCLSMQTGAQGKRGRR